MNPHAPLSPDQQALYKFRIERSVDLFLGRLSTASNIALTGINGLLLVNGGAIVALFTFVGQSAETSAAKALTESQLLWWAFGAFATGLSFALAAAILALWSQQAFATYEHELVEHCFDALYGQKPRDLDHGDVTTHNVCLYLAIACMVASLVAFGGGSALALKGAAPAHSPETPQKRPASP